MDCRHRSTERLRPNVRLRIIHAPWKHKSIPKGIPSSGKTTKRPGIPWQARSNSRKVAPITIRLHVVRMRFDPNPTRWPIGSLTWPVQIVATILELAGMADWALGDIHSYILDRFRNTGAFSERCSRGLPWKVEYSCAVSSDVRWSTTRDREWGRPGCRRNEESGERANCPIACLFAKQAADRRFFHAPGSKACLAGSAGRRTRSRAWPDRRSAICMSAP